MQITDSEARLYIALSSKWKLEKLKIDDTGMPTMVTLMQQSNIYLPSTMEMVPKKTCTKVPGKMYYGERRMKCSECGYGLGDKRWNFCPQCGSEIIDDKQEKYKLD